MIIILKKASFYFCIGLFLLASCGKEKNPDYHPMSVGAQWEYSGTMRFGSGEVVSVKSIGHIAEKEMLQGKEYYKLITTYEGPASTPPQTVSYLRKTEEGIYLIAAEQKDKPELLSTPLPIRTGSSWELASYAPTVKGKYRVEGKETVYVTGGKKYEDCLKVYLEQEQDGTRGERLDYMAPNIGMVKQLVTFGDISLEISLKRYTPGND